MKKNVVKVKKVNKEKTLTLDVLEKVLDQRFKEHAVVILDAVDKIMKKNTEDSERRMLAYTELRTQEIIYLFKDERVDRKEKHANYYRRISALENKVAVLETKS